MLAQKKDYFFKNPFYPEKGGIIQKPVIAYEEYGNPKGETVLITHGGLQNQHAAGKYSEKEVLAGTWDDLIGDRKAIDTLKYRVIAVNSPGSMFGSSGPLSINPDTGKNYGPDFPTLTMADMARFFKQFLDETGVQKLSLMAGPSMGSLQTLLFAALYPGFAEKIMAVATSGRMTPGGIAFHRFMKEIIQNDPEFNNGWYQTDKPLYSLKVIHEIARIYYTHETGIKKYFWDTVPEGQNAQFERMDKIRNYLVSGIDEYLTGRDPNSYIRLTDAIDSYSLGYHAESYEKGVERIQCPVLLVNISSDSEFPPYWAYEVADILNKKNPGQAVVRIIESDWGHIGCIKETKKIAEHLKNWM